MPKFVTIQYGHVGRWWREAASTDPAESRPRRCKRLGNDGDKLHSQRN